MWSCTVTSASLVRFFQVFRHSCLHLSSVGITGMFYHAFVHNSLSAWNICLPFPKKLTHLLGFFLSFGLRLQNISRMCPVSHQLIVQTTCPLLERTDKSFQPHLPSPHSHLYCLESISNTENRFGHNLLKIFLLVFTASKLKPYLPFLVKDMVRRPVQWTSTLLSLCLALKALLMLFFSQWNASSYSDLHGFQDSI